MATSTPASANSPASINPVGPPPAITTACSVTRIARLPFAGSSIDQKVWPTRATLQHDRALAASPAVRYMLEVASKVYPQVSPPADSAPPADPGAHPPSD